MAATKATAASPSSVATKRETIPKIYWGDSMKPHGLLPTAMLVAALAQWALADSAPPGTADSGPTPPAVAKELDLIDQAEAKSDAKDWHGAAAILKQVAESPDFGQLSDVAQHLVFHDLAVNDYYDKDNDGAWSAIQQACSSKLADASDWFLRLFVAQRRDDDSDSLDSLTLLAERYPDTLNDIRFQTFAFVERRAERLKDGADRQARLLKALFAVADRWKPGDADPDSADGFWGDLVRYDLKNQKYDDAKAVASRISDPTTIIGMRIEKQYDALTTADPAHYDIDAAYKHELDVYKDWMAGQPDKLKPIVEYTLLLVQLGRFDEAVALLDQTIAHAGSGASSPFADYDEQINWAYDTRARALIALGRVDDGLADFAKGATVGDEGPVNISQTINLADNLYLHDRPQDALATLAKLDRDSGSPYGRMAYEEARGCAYAEMKDAADLANTMAYVEAHAADAPSVKVHLLLCTGDLDGAAAAAIANLNDPSLMRSVLWELQRYRKPSAAAHLGAFEALLDQRRDALRARPDVQAAIDKVGRILSLPIVDLE